MASLESAVKATRVSHPRVTLLWALAILASGTVGLAFYAVGQFRWADFYTWTVLSAATIVGYYVSRYLDSHSD